MASYSFLIVFLISAVFTYVQACEPVFKDCGSVGGKVISIGYNGTCQPDRIVLKKKTYAGITIQFQSNEASPSLSAVVHGQVAGIFVNFPIDNPDACKNSNISCPVQSGKTYVYNSVIYVRTIFPSIPVIVKWELQDADQKDVVCIVLPAEITG